MVRRTFGGLQNLKEALTKTVPLQSAQPDRPYVIRCDASDYAVGAVIEQLPPTDLGDENLVERIKRERCTRPVAFMSRKLTGGQKKWSVREKETYAMVCALQKWSTWIQAQPVYIVTDHKSLEVWHKEHLDTPSGPAGRRARWHEFFSRFWLTVIYEKGAENIPADGMSRWAYPASLAMNDVSKHGSEKDKEEVQEMLKEENELRQAENETSLNCLKVTFQNAKCQNVNIVTRSGGDTSVDPAELIAAEGFRKADTYHLRTSEPPTATSTSKANSTLGTIYASEWGPLYDTCPTWSKTWKKQKKVVKTGQPE